MTSATRRLDEDRRQYGLFPGKRGFVSFCDFRCGTLTAMADGAAPIADMVRDRRVGAERLRDGFIRKTCLRDSLVASGTAVDHVHCREPDLIDVRSIVCHELFCIRPGLRKTQVRTLVLFPFAT